MLFEIKVSTFQVFLFFPAHNLNLTEYSVELISTPKSSSIAPYWLTNKSRIKRQKLNLWSKINYQKFMGLTGHRKDLTNSHKIQNLPEQAIKLEIHYTLAFHTIFLLFFFSQPSYIFSPFALFFSTFSFTLITSIFPHVRLCSLFI